MKKQKHPEIEIKSTIKDRIKVSKTCIVVGPMPFKTPKLKALKGADLIFIDGGLKHLNKFKKASFSTYGDGDSSQKPMDLKKTNQNLSDLAFFFKEAAKKNNLKKYDQYLLLGFLGGRVDHELINFGEIARFMLHFKSSDKVKVMLEDKIEFFPKGVSEFSISGTFSLVSFEPCDLKIDGLCSYKSRNTIKLLPLSSRGLSNVGSGLIKIQNSAPIALFKGQLKA